MKSSLLKTVSSLDYLTRVKGKRKIKEEKLLASLL